MAEACTVGLEVLAMRNASVMIVDDDASLVESLAELLREEGYQVLVATCGREGLDLAERLNRIDIAIVDIHMPDISGLEIIRVIRQRISQARVIVISGDDAKGTMSRAMEAGAQSFIVKPITPGLLLREIERFLAQISDSSSAV